MLNLVVLVSGGGSNLLALLRAIAAGTVPAQVVAVGADRDAAGLAHAQQAGIPIFVVPFSAYRSRETWGAALQEGIAQYAPDLVILSGFMRLLPESVVRALSPRLINTHPAFLPEFPGAHGVRDALNARVDRTGASVIVVDSGVDSGPVLAQQRVDILPTDTESTLHDRIKLVERQLLIETISHIADGTIDLKEFA